MRKLAIAALIAAPFSLSAAEHMDLDGMMEGLSMLETTAQSALDDYDIEGDVQTLTISQLAQIHGILTSSMSEDDKGRRIEAIVEN